jgi:hypothetical protein
LDLVEGLTPSETEEETADTAGAINVEVPAPTVNERERGKTLDEDDEPGLTET